MSKNSKDIVITSAFRTAIGKYKGIWENSQSSKLGELVIKKILEDTKLNSNLIDEVIMGQVLTGNAGQNPARQAAIRAGIPKEKTGYIINQVCGSGLRSIAAGYQSILLNEAKIIIAGGQESMSNSNEDEMLKDGLIDAYNNYHMGITENVAEKWNISDRVRSCSWFSTKIKLKFDEKLVNKNISDQHQRVMLL